MSSPPGQQDDALAREMAARIQAAHHHWLIIWSPWRHQFTAFGCFAPVPIIIDEADQHRLIQQMRAAELRFERPGEAP